jgi:hypothetical protein
VSAGHVRDLLVSEPVEECEKRIEGDEYQRGAADEGWSRRRHAAMADIGPVACGRLTACAIMA